MDEANQVNVETKDAEESLPVTRDEDGIPIDREPTLDDVRSDGEPHRLAALGCTAVVVTLVLAFWIIRALLG